MIAVWCFQKAHPGWAGGQIGRVNGGTYDCLAASAPGVVDCGRIMSMMRNATSMGSEVAKLGDVGVREVERRRQVVGGARARQRRAGTDGLS